VKTSLNETKRK